MFEFELTLVCEPFLARRESAPYMFLGLVDAIAHPPSDVDLDGSCSAAGGC